MNSSIMYKCCEDQIPEGTFFADIGGDQFSAIKLSIKLGRIIQVRFTDIAEKYKAGCTHSMLVEEYKITDVFNVSEAVAMSSVCRAIRGWEGGMKMEAYAGLLPKEELDGLATRHLHLSGKHMGDLQVLENKGIHLQTKEQRDAIRRLAIIACGMTPYSQEEIDFIEELANKPEYAKGQYTDVRRIAREVNEKFHHGKNIRTPRTMTKLRVRIQQKRDTITK